MGCRLKLAVCGASGRVGVICDSNPLGDGRELGLDLHVLLLVLVHLTMAMAMDVDGQDVGRQTGNGQDNDVLRIHGC